MTHSSDESKKGAGTSGRESAPNFPYIFRLDRLGRKGQRCRMTTQHRFSALQIEVEFEDGFRMITSANAVRRAKDSDKPAQQAT